VHLPLEIDEHNLYMVDQRSFVWALNRYSGTTVWVQEALRARPTSGVSVYKNMVLLGDYKGYLHVLDGSDGRIIERMDMGSRISVQPYVDGDRAYVINKKGDLYAITIERLSKAD
jgi:outer membrane protein assembly factor BamB